MASYLSDYCVVLFILNCYILDFIYSDFIIIIWAIFVNRFGTLIMSHYNIKILQRMLKCIRNKKI